MAKRKTEEQKTQIISGIESAIQSGESLNLRSAAKAAGISDATYYKWKKDASKTKRQSLAKRPTAIITYDVPEPESDRIVLIIGASAHVKTALDRLAQIQGVR